MRVSPDLYAPINSGISSSEASLQSAVTQLSTGKRVQQPSDDASAFAQNLRSLAETQKIDRYSSNASGVTTVAQISDTALSSVVTSLTQAITLGTQSGNSDLSASNRASLATQVQGIQLQILAQANTTWNGTAVFAGNADAPTAFTSDSTAPAGIRYTGSSTVNTVQVGDDSSVALGLSGSGIFSSSTGDVFGSLANLGAAVSSGDQGALSIALQSVSAAIAHIGEVRSTYAGVVNQLDSATNTLTQQDTYLKAQQSALTDVDTATAATQLAQAQTQHSAILAIAAKILPESLLNYLH